MIGRLSDIDLRLLRVFVAVVDAGGFSLATAKLNVAESTISQHMTDLEKRLGIRLCERGRSGFRLTESGEQVYKLTADLLADLERYRDKVASVAADTVGTLRLGLPDAVITDTSNRLAVAIGDYLRDHPDVDLDVTMLTPRDLERGVLEGRLHVAIAPEHRRVASLRFLPLYSERNSLYCGRGHPLFEHPNKPVSDHVLNRSNRIARGYLDRFDAQFFNEPVYRATVHQIEAAALLIVTGECIGFLPNHFAAAWVARDEMRAIRPERFSFTSTFGFIFRSEAADDPKIASFISGFRKAQ